MTRFNSEKYKNPELYIVGCGPGDPDLLTMKAFKIIKSAKTILFDNLVSDEIINITEPDCLKVYVGKKPYQHSTPQDEINRSIKFYAHSRGTVVRLKGGDPYIFGRGYEELDFARRNDIACTYIPGISSMQTCGLSGIPLTHRGMSEGVWAITGTRKDGSLSADLQLAARSTATVVVYMGMSKLAEIARIYVQAGKGTLPACIIENASLSSQRKVHCCVQALPVVASEKKLGNPAIILIGAVAGLASETRFPMETLTKAM